MTIKQLSVFLENKPGKLAGMMKALADSADFGIVRMIVDDHVKGCDVLAKAGFAVVQTDVVMATVPDHPGGMAEIMEKLDHAGVDIEYSYAYALGSGEKAILVFKFDDNTKAEQALEG